MKNSKLPVILYWIVVVAVIVILLDQLAIKLIGPSKDFDDPVTSDNLPTWEDKANFSAEYHFPGYGNVTYSTQDLGFRNFGNTETDKLKVFIIGDSFTGAVEVSDGKLYFNHLARLNSGIEIFAYGGIGYGTLQEYMILDKHYDLIKPDLVLWQFCTNDIINNSHALESQSFLHNNQALRPYYNQESGQTEWLEPAQNYGALYRYLRESYIFRPLRLHHFIEDYRERHSIESRLTEDDPSLQDSIATTSAVMAKAKQRIGNTPIIAFAAITDEFPAVTEQTFAEIAGANGIPFIPNVKQALNDAESRGVLIDGAETGGDEHWNEAGHAVVGKVLHDYLFKNGYLQLNP